jgi:hypothetical protein
VYHRIDTGDARPIRQTPRRLPVVKQAEVILRDITYESCLVYLDGMIVIYRTFEEHLRNLLKVFQRFREVHM